MLALLAAIALVASVGTASAAAAQWYTGTTATNGTLLTSKEPLATALAIENKQSFKTGNPGWKGLHMIWTLLGNQLVTEISGVECVSCSIRNTTETATAIGEGKLKFTGVKIYGKPVGTCQIASETGEVGTLISRNLEWKLMTLGGKQYVVFLPFGGYYGTLIQLKLTECGAAEGTYNLLGSLAAEPSAAGATTAWNLPAKLHGLSFSKEIQEAAGASFMSEHPGWFEGSLVDSLPSGKYWNAK